MTVNKVILVSPRGFCAGVDRAITVVEDCLALFGKPIYVKHQIVHNKYVVDALEKKGAITVETVSEIPEGARAVFSAHGSPPKDFEEAKQRNIKVIDATCPLVTKVHMEAVRFAKNGYHIIYIGKHNHPEAIGVLAEVPDSITLLTSLEELNNLEINNPEKIIYLTQTTLSIYDTNNIIEALKEKFPHIRDPPKEDICFATTNRQNAIIKLAKEVDLILVVGSENSSNSNKLVYTAKQHGTSAYLIDDVSKIGQWFDGVTTIGISAGASAPDYLVRQVADYFVKQGAVIENLNVIKENVQFKEPRELVLAKNERLDS